jgi:hypothetical protein
LRGVEALIRGDFSGFNAKIKVREQELRGILLRSDVKVVLVVAYSSPSNLSDPVTSTINELLAQQNNVGDMDIFTLEVFDLKRIYGELSGHSASRNIKIEIALTEWGTIETPYRAYYGQVKVADVAGWALHGRGLLDRNLRFYRGATEVNDAMETTLGASPDRFWYFNNGITILCSSIAKKVLNGDSRNYGIFDCQGVSVVNGAQTVGVIWELARKDSTISKSDAKVLIRVISLEDCPEGFDADVTRATNTQNRIQHRDFAALDPLQQRLAREMALDGKRYAFKSGDPDPKGEEGCNIEEATIALACEINDVTIAVQAKREVGGLWRDISKPPYTTIFHEKLSARGMWRSVQISRIVSEELAVLDKREHPRGELIAVHGNRFILYRVFQDTIIRNYKDLRVSDEQVVKGVKAVTQKVFAEVVQVVQERHPAAYLATLFKNTHKCKELLSDVPVAAVAPTLFDLQ